MANSSYRKLSHLTETGVGGIGVGAEVGIIGVGVGAGPHVQVIAISKGNMKEPPSFDLSNMPTLLWHSLLVTIL
jgi:hypothetical protein